MKKNRIIKIITPPTQLNDPASTLSSYTATIIIPHIPLPLAVSSKTMLETMLKDLLVSPKRILKVKEENLVMLINPNAENYEIKRNFNILVDDTLMKISDMENCLNLSDELEKKNIKKYLKDYSIKMKNLNKTYNYSHLVFNYLINELKVPDDETPQF